MSAARVIRIALSEHGVKVAILGTPGRKWAPVAFLSPTGVRVARLPALDADPYRQMPAHPAVLAERVAALTLATNRKKIHQHPTTR